MPPAEATPRAKAAALKAVELDSSLAEAWYSLAVVRAWGEWDWDGADDAFRRAIALNPNLAPARSTYSHLLLIARRPDEAIAEIELALQLDPLNPLVQSLYGIVLLFVGRNDEAIARFRKTLTTVPNHPLAQTGLWGGLHDKGMYEEAFEELRVWYAPGDKEIHEALERGYAEGGYTGAMNLVAETWAARSQVTYVSPWSIARLYAYAGRNDKALGWFEKAVEERNPNVPYIGVSPAFGGLRPEPRFQDLLRRMNLPN